MASLFQPNHHRVFTCLSFTNTLCTPVEKSLPLLMENIENHQITHPRWRKGFFSSDVVGWEQPKHYVRNLREKTNAIRKDQMYKDCHILHSTIPSQSINEIFSFVFGNENSFVQPRNSTGHCTSADARMNRRLPGSFLHRISGVRSTGKKNFPKDKFYPAGTPLALRL